jgi:hypothetical protein
LADSASSEDLIALSMSLINLTVGFLSPFAGNRKNQSTLIKAIPISIKIAKYEVVIDIIEIFFESMIFLYIVEFHQNYES